MSSCTVVRADDPIHRRLRVSVATIRDDVPITGGTKTRRGPAPRASREDVLAAALEWFVACKRIDVQALAGELGVGRATIYRWFGSREGLLGEVLVSAAKYVVRN